MLIVVVVVIVIMVTVAALTYFLQLMSPLFRLRAMFPMFVDSLVQLLFGFVDIFIALLVVAIVSERGNRASEKAGNDERCNEKPGASENLLHRASF